MIKSNALTFAFMVMTAVFVTNCSDPLLEPTGKYDKKKMEQAIMEARSTFDEFLARFRKPHPGDSGFNVKVRIEDENGTEYFWLGNLQLDTEPYSGVIDNDPGIVKNVKYGQRHSFTRDEISDWMYMTNRAMQGNYTLKVLLESMPKDEADALRKKIGW